MLCSKPLINAGIQDFSIARSSVREERCDWLMLFKQNIECNHRGFLIRPLALCVLSEKEVLSKLLSRSRGTSLQVVGCSRALIKAFGFRGRWGSSGKFLQKGQQFFMFKISPIAE